MTEYEALLNKRLNELYNTMGEEWVNEAKRDATRAYYNLAGTDQRIARSLFDTLLNSDFEFRNAKTPSP